jgi:hypothetical protein
VKFNRAVVISSAVAHGLAWAAFLWLAFWPSFYTGTTATPTLTPFNPNGTGGEAAPFPTPINPDSTGGEAVRVSASIIEGNGLGVLVPMLVPVALTAIGLLNALTRDRRNTISKFLMWASAVLLIVFCGMAMFTIGMFYLPAAVALLVAAVIMSVGATPNLTKDEIPT